MAQIEVVLGTSKGWKYRIRAGEVRIGRAAGNNVKVQDPAWQDGYLHVRHVQGGYAVTNHMPHPVFLDGEVLPEGEQRTWYHGARLQPTASTVLVLYADGSIREGEQRARGVVAVAPEQVEKGSRWHYYLLAGSAVLTAVMVFTLGGARGGSSAQQAAEFQEVVVYLGELRQTPPHEHRATRVLLQVKEARFCEARQQHQQALVHYLRARNELDHLSGQEKAQQQKWQDVRAFIGRRVAELAGQYGLPGREEGW
jgi:hypothetical protein